MNILRRLLLGVVFFSMLSFLHRKVQAEPTDSLTVKSSFCLDDQYYVCLSDNSHFVPRLSSLCNNCGYFSKMI
ncbi:MAG: hypothetical protein WBD50_06405 [Candidatus Rhabdochlamydia sp.]